MLKDVIDFLRFGLRRMNRLNKALFFLLILTSISSLVSAIFIPIFQKNIIAGIQSSDSVSLSVLLMIALSLINTAFAIYEVLVCNKLNMELKQRMQKDLIETGIRYGSKIIDARDSGAFMMNAFGDTEQIANAIKTNYFSVAIMCFSSLIAICVSLAWSWIFTAVVFPIFALMLIVITVSNKIYAKYYAIAREHVMKLNPKLLERIENRASVLGFADIGSIESDLYRDFDERDKNFGRAHKALAFSRTFTDIIKTLGLAALFLLSIKPISSGALSIPAFIAILSYYAIVFAPIPAAQNIIEQMETYKLHYARVKDDLNRTPETLLPQNKTLRLADCSFSYSDNNESGQVKNLSIRIDKNIGLVGLSGEGKTTIIKILLGKIIPQSGECLLGNVNVSRVSRAVLHSLVRVCGQDLELFDDTLEYNITLGKKPVGENEYADIILKYEQSLRDTVSKLNNHDYKHVNAEILKALFLFNDIQVKDAAILSSVTEELNNSDEMFPVYTNLLASRAYYIADRYDAIVCDLGIGNLSGRTFGQRGAKISGGEKNKISIARFLLPSLKGFYIIDEPLTSVDAISEELCVNAIGKYLNCAGGIIISHKLNIIRALTDEIIVLKNGNIQSKGNHDELIGQDGLYSELYSKFVDLKGL
ncbi:hypothetical protein FACS189490_12290 [Clostridia bacterium]|nr:hypothetical protein FACS189490_12290 [Clostridia bacterium]